MTTHETFPKKLSYKGFTFPLTIIFGKQKSRYHDPKHLLGKWGLYKYLTYNNIGQWQIIFHTSAVQNVIRVDLVLSGNDILPL